MLFSFTQCHRFALLLPTIFYNKPSYPVTPAMQFSRDSPSPPPKKNKTPSLHVAFLCFRALYNKKGRKKHCLNYTIV